MNKIKGQIKNVYLEIATTHIPRERFEGFVPMGPEANSPLKATLELSTGKEILMRVYFHIYTKDPQTTIIFDMMNFSKHFSMKEYKECLDIVAWYTGEDVTSDYYDM